MASTALLPSSAPRALGQPGRYSDASLVRFGTRLVLPRLVDPGGRSSSAVLHVAVNGWRRSHVLVVELGEAAGCPSSVAAARVKAVHCVSNLGPMSSTALTLSQAAAGLGTIAVYSINATELPNGCASFDAVKSGALDLSAWESSVWYAHSGDPIGVIEEAAEEAFGATRMTLLAGRPMLPVTMTSGTGQAISGGQTTTALPVVTASESRAWLVSQRAGCSAGRSRMVAESAGNGCPNPATQAFAVGAMGAASLTPPMLGSFGATLQLTEGVMAVVDINDQFTWRTLTGHVPAGADTQGQLSFPMGLSPVTQTRSTLWVTNQHPTATAQIDVLMWDGNQKLKLYRDAVPLCAGSSRQYDVAAIAGTVDPTRQRGGLPAMGPMLALRVESTNRDLPQAPPIAGAVLFDGPDGAGGYTGFTVPPEVSLLHQRAQRTFGMNLTTVVPDVKINDGEPAASTVLAVQSVMNPAANAFTLELYSITGTLIVPGFDVGLPGGLTGAQVVDLGALAGRRVGDQGRYMVPQHFRGTAVLRGQQNVGMLGVVAVDVPLDTLRPRPGGALDGGREAVRTAGPLGLDKARRDVIGVTTGQMLPRWPDVRTPSPTPTRTRIPLTRTPTPTRTASSTATPRPPTATSTPRPSATPRSGRLWLPRLDGGGAE